MHEGREQQEREELDERIRVIERFCCDPHELAEILRLQRPLKRIAEFVTLGNSNAKSCSCASAIRASRLPAAH
jgi:hypothetical protein